MFNVCVICKVLGSRQVGIVSTHGPWTHGLSVNAPCQRQCQLNTPSLGLHVYWAEIFDNMISKPVLLKRTKANLSQFHLTQTGAESLKLTNSNFAKNFRLFFNDMILIHLKHQRVFYQVTRVFYQVTRVFCPVTRVFYQVTRVFCLQTFFISFLFLLATVFWEFLWAADYLWHSTDVQSPAMSFLKWVHSATLVHRDIQLVMYLRDEGWGINKIGFGKIFCY